MEFIVVEILAANKKPVKVGKVFEIKRDPRDSDICQATFSGASEKAKYYIKFNIVTKEILVFHKNIRTKNRDDRKKIKEEFWKKWNPSQFCMIKKEEALKFKLFEDLDKVIENEPELDEIDWSEILNVGKFPLEREP